MNVYTTTFDSWETSFGNNGITATISSTKPTYRRGHWFDKATPAYMSLSDFKLNLAFTVSAWVRHETPVTNPTTIFSKDKATGDNVMIQIYIATSNKLGISIPDTTNAASFEPKESGATLTEKTWAFVSAAI
jgi:hypothetical protein